METSSAMAAESSAALRKLLSSCKRLVTVNLFGTVPRNADRRHLQHGGIFEALHAAVAASPGGMRVELAFDRTPPPLRIYCGSCRRCAMPRAGGRLIDGGPF